MTPTAMTTTAMTTTPVRPATSAALAPAGAGAPAALSGRLDVLGVARVSGQGPEEEASGRHEDQSSERDGEGHHPRVPGRGEEHRDHTEQHPDAKRDEGQQR